MTVTSWFADYAWLPSGFARDVAITVADGRFAEVTPGAQPNGAGRLPGVVLPGFANNHSHAFHRALRGRTHDLGGTFWTWRERMYAVAERLDPDSYLDLARATYAEMALAGVTSVGEFHYLHHAPGGVPYDDPNAMGRALVEAASDAGVRLTLLDTCYLAGGLGPDGHLPLEGPQLRFGDRDVDAWASRWNALADSDDVRVGAAIHSVRAVPREYVGTAAALSGTRPLHVHLSEQVAENEACRGYYGVTPTVLLEEEGVWTSRTTAVHATHLSVVDIELLGQAAATVCLCPTTERDLGDGIGPALTLFNEGTRLSLGSDQNAVVDLLVEAQCLEGHERLASRQRGRFTTPQLLDALTHHGGIGWADAGRIEPGARADLVAVRTDSVRTAGALPAQVVSCATAADVDTVVVGGRTIVSGGVHVLGDVAALMARAVEPLWANA